MTSTPTSTSRISILQFFYLASSLVFSVYVYSALATSGFSLVFFVLATVLFFFIPSALVSAELATVKDWGSGGVYKWCGLALGKRWGFFAAFCQWFQVTIAFIAMLYFMVGSLSHVVDISFITSNAYLKFIFVISIFWLITLLSLKGPTIANKIANIGTSFGLILPVIALIVLTALYVFDGHTINIAFTWRTFFPKSLNVADLSIFVTFLFAYVGIEVSANNVNKLDNPKKNYPLALLLIIIAAFLFSVLASLSIAVIIPEKEINMSEGFLQAFGAIFKIYNAEWLVSVTGVSLIIGVVAKVISWISGPSEGMVEAAKAKILPDYFSKMDKNGTPYVFILAQALLVTIWAYVLIILVDDGTDLPYLLAMNLSSIIYLAMYTVLFLSYFLLKVRYPNDERTFVVPGGKTGQRIVPTIGLLTVCFAIAISFFPPSHLKSQNTTSSYEVVLISSFIIVMLLPNIIYSCRKKYISSASTTS